MFLRTYQTSLTCIVIFFIALVSFQFNALHVAPDGLFLSHQLDSEQYVLDGILHAERTNTSPTLGRYTRPSLKSEAEHYEKAHMLFNTREDSGEFAPYRSQFGLQAYLFYFMHEVFNASIFAMQFFCSAVMALTVAAFFWALRKEFSFLGSTVFCVSLITSPWVVVFARNLFWIEATLFLPIIATLSLGKIALSSSRHRFILTFVLFVCFLFKFLCGLEYITTIFISSLVPLVYFCLKYDSKKILFKFIFSTSATALCALIFAFTLQAIKISPSLVDGLKYIQTIAEKNVSSNDPVAIANGACSDKFMSIVNREDCINNYVRSLKVRHMAIVNDYLIFWRFLPWVENFKLPIDSDKIDALRLAIGLKNPSRVIKVLKDYSLYELVFAVLMISPVLLFFALLSAVTIKLFTATTIWPWRILIILSFCAPMSWFFMAKAHSYFHKHINFILWYICFIPFSLLFITDTALNNSEKQHNA